MTSAGFRRIALALTNAVEQAHHGHPDFRVGGRIFATLGHPDARWGMVSLTPEQQQTWVRACPTVFTPVKGVWGEQGATSVRLDNADEEMLGEALTQAWRNAVDKGPTRGGGRKRPAKRNPRGVARRRR